MPLLDTIANRLFSAPERICLERAELLSAGYHEHRREPPVIRRALAFRHLLHHMTLDLKTNPVFAGNTAPGPGACLVFPEFGFEIGEPVASERPELSGMLVEAVTEDLCGQWLGRQLGRGAGPGHVALDYEVLVHRGLQERLDRLAELENKGVARQRNYRQAMAISLQAVCEWAERYALTAERAAEATAEAGKKHLAACYRRMAKACHQVPRYPARDVFEGLQAMLLLHLAAVLEGQGQGLSVGLPDRVLARYSESVTARPKAAADLVAAFLLALAANNCEGRGSKAQAITIGGIDAEGRDCANAVSQAFVDGFARVPVADPHLFVRWSPGGDPQLVQQAAKLIAAGRSLPGIVNDDQVLPALLECGIDVGDATDYCVIGSNGVGIPGRLCQSALTTGLAFDEMAWFDAAARRVARDAHSPRDLLIAYRHEARTAVWQGLSRRRQEQHRFTADAPFPFTSACSDDCLEGGGDWLTHHLYNQPMGLRVRGTANAIDALAAIARLVFAERYCSLPEFFDRLDARDPELLARLAAAPKWGRDDDEADRWGLAICRTRDEVLRELAAAEEVWPFAVSHSPRGAGLPDPTAHGPTADGRDAGDPQGEGLGPVAGYAPEGPTAVLNSVLKLDAVRQFPGLGNVELALRPEQARADVIQALTSAFCADGGQLLTLSVLDAQRLREGCENPERLADLLVRSGGCSQRWGDLTPSARERLATLAERLEARPEDDS